MNNLLKKARQGKSPKKQNRNVGSYEQLELLWGYFNGEFGVRDVMEALGRGKENPNGFYAWAMCQIKWGKDTGRIVLLSKGKNN